ncbi:MAG: formylglycine-generating enzyme family protein [Planctomycetia bacterium]|nr:formylglycine-generating enzyme family protein [Planctomycetia bacterium]
MLKSSRMVLSVATLCSVVLGGVAYAAEEEAPRPWRLNTIDLITELGPRAVENADAETEADMKEYTEYIAGTDITFDMVPIAGGKFLMGATEDELDEFGVDTDEYLAIDNASETPQHEVEVAPFWMGKCEVTWAEYEAWAMDLEMTFRKTSGFEATPYETLADGIIRPTKPYTDMTFDMGKDKRPAIAMSLYAAQMYCKWLSVKTGRYYRLPTEAEWEYACRAGTDTPYSFEDPDDMDDYAWYYDNADDKYQKVGQKDPNPWGLYDMHGNVREWCMDEYKLDSYQQMVDAADGKTVSNPCFSTEGRKRYFGVARGGSYYDDPENLRSAVRFAANTNWNNDDPQIPKSIWFESSAKEVGFRVVRPLEVPTAEEAAVFEPDPQIALDYMKLNARQQQ